MSNYHVKLTISIFQRRPAPIVSFVIEATYKLNSKNIIETYTKDIPITSLDESIVKWVEEVLEKIKKNAEMYAKADEIIQRIKQLIPSEVEVQTS